MLEIWAEKEARFNLMLAASLPKVVIADPKITAAGDVYTIEFNVENQGFIPTALRQAQLVKIVRPDTLSMVFPDGMTSTQAAGGRGGRGDFGGAAEANRRLAEASRRPGSRHPSRAGYEQG